MAVTGIAVSKALWDVVIGASPVHRFANRGPGIRRLLQHRGRAGTTQAVCEATGVYERRLVRRLRASDSDRTQRTRQTSSGAGSNGKKPRPKVSCKGIPYGSARNVVG